MERDIIKLEPRRGDLLDNLRVLRVDLLSLYGFSEEGDVIGLLDSAIEQAKAIDAPHRYAVELWRTDNGQLAGKYAPEYVGGETLQACSEFVARNVPMLQATELRIVRAES